MAERFEYFLSKTNVVLLCITSYITIVLNFMCMFHFSNTCALCGNVRFLFVQVLKLEMLPSTKKKRSA